MNKQPEITEQTRRNILEAFWSLYQTRGMTGVTVKEIAAKSGYNRGTFYEYFRDASDCLAAIEDECRPRVSDLPSSGGTDNSLENRVESLLEDYNKHFRYWRVLLGERGDPSFRRRLIEGIKGSILASPVFKNLNAKEAREFDLQLEYILSGMIGLLVYCVHGKKGPDREDIAAILKIMEGSHAQRLRELVGRGQAGLETKKHEALKPLGK